MQQPFCGSVERATNEISNSDSIKVTFRTSLCERWGWGRGVDRSREGGREGVIEIEIEIEINNYR